MKKIRTKERTMANVAKPPYRADQIGSLIRPDHLLKARKQRDAGRLPNERLREIENEAIREVVKRQEALGLHPITDGEFRRYMFHIDFLDQIGGIEKRPGTFKHAFKGGHSHKDDWKPIVYHVVGKLRHERDITVDDFKFLQSVTERTPKVTIPAPTFVYGRAGLKEINRAAYPDLEEFFADLGRVYQAELAALAKAGCTYVQLDETNLPILCDPKLAAAVRERGDDPEKLASLHIRSINDAISGRPEGLSVAVHFCRGNYRGSWVAEGGYDPIAERVFGTLDVDGYMLEYDDERSGGFEPLRYIPKSKMVVLGLVTTKNPSLESGDTLKRRIDQASKHLPLDQLGISPQCGFSSGAIEGGDVMSPAQQWAKLELVANVAREVWGTTLH
jgi:5-methyltetrahydropteroyltriglutamate--homocysteine methyltransferase